MDWIHQSKATELPAGLRKKTRPSVILSLGDSVLKTNMGSKKRNERLYSKQTAARRKYGVATLMSEHQAKNGNRRQK